MGHAGAIISGGKGTAQVEGAKTMGISWGFYMILQDLSGTIAGLDRIFMGFFKI